MGRGRWYFAVQALGGAAWWIAVPFSEPVRTATLGSLDPLAVAVLDLPLFVVASAAAAAGVRWAAVVATAWTLVVTLGLAARATLTTEAGPGVLLMAAASAGSVLAASVMIAGRVPTAWIFRGPFAARPAAASTPRLAHVAATGVQIVVFWGFFLVAAPLVLATLEERWRLAVPFPPQSAAAGAIVLVLASGLGLAAAAVMSTRGGGTPLPASTAARLVIAGPYRVVRNPMAVAGLAQAIGVACLLSSWFVVAFAVVGAVIWNEVVRPVEEADLEARFGEPYRRYREAVCCWWPGDPRSSA